MTRPKTRHVGSPNRDTPSTPLLIMLKPDHYYHVRITAQPEEQCRDLDAVDSMIPRATHLPAEQTTLSPDQPEPLTTIVSGQASTWHPGHTLSCLWRWAQQR